MINAEINAGGPGSGADNQKLDFPDIPKNVLGHIYCLVTTYARKFSLSDDDRDELNSRLYHATVMAAKFGRWDPQRATIGTYLCGVIRHELFDWRSERFADKPREGETNEEFLMRLSDYQQRDRRILYAPSRYGTVGKMIRRIDWNLALETLEPPELALLRAYVYGNAPLKETGNGLGLSKNRTLTLFASVKHKFATSYGRKLPEEKRDKKRDQNSTVRE